MDKKIIAGFIVTFILGVLVSTCMVRWHGYGANKYYRETDTAMMQKQQEIKMGHSMGSMEHQMMGMTDRMKGKTGDELDKIFLTDMIVHHQGAVDMAEALLKETKRPELQKMGKDIIEVQNKEIEQMESWLTTWFK